MHVDEWPPLPTRSGPSTSKRTPGSNTITELLLGSNLGLHFQSIFLPTTRETSQRPGLHPAWAHGSQTTWEAMIRSDQSQKLNLAGNGTGPDDIPTLKNTQNPGS